MLASKKRVFALIWAMFFIMLAFSNLAFGAEASFKTLNVSVKPEYDKEQKIFYMYLGELKNSGQVSVYAPKDIINDQTVQFCLINEQNQHLCQPREKTTEGIYTKFSGNIPGRKFMFEGYSPFTKEINGNKSFEYSFKAGQNIEELNIAIAEPKGASNFKVEPAAKSTATDEDGLNNSLFSYKNVKKGKEYKFKVSYTKDNWDVSVTNPQTTGQTSTTDNTGDGGVSGLTVFGAIVAAALVAGGVLFAFARLGQAGGVKSSRRTQMPVAPKGKARFCTNCGARLSGGKFCPNCGAKI